MELAKRGFLGLALLYWPLQDIRSLVFVCKNQSSLYYPRSFRITHTTAILLRNCCAIYDLSPTLPSYAIHMPCNMHNCCAIYDLSPTLPSYAIHHTILAMPISCKGLALHPKWNVLAPALGGAGTWPLQDIVITNIVWCMA